MVDANGKNADLLVRAVQAGAYAALANYYLASAENPGVIATEFAAHYAEKAAELLGDEWEPGQS